MIVEKYFSLTLIFGCDFFGLKKMLQNDLAVNKIIAAISVKLFCLV